jgi:hypothetical protein
MRYLLLGAGAARDRRIDPQASTLDQASGRRCPPRPADFSDGELVTLDVLETVGADLVADLDRRAWLCRGLTERGRECLTLDRVPLVTMRESQFDEVHAYEVLEHLGHQGNADEFFSTFENIYRLLVPGGYLCATVPSLQSRWLWSDPGHRRAIAPESLVFLSRRHEVAPPSSDYRGQFYCDFEKVSHYDDGATHAFILRAVKPARPYWPEPLEAGA